MRSGEGIVHYFQVSERACFFEDAKIFTTDVVKPWELFEFETFVMMINYNWFSQYLADGLL